MEYRFISDFEPKEGDVGKVILYLVLDEIHLNRSVTRDWAEYISRPDVSDEEIFSRIHPGMPVGEKVGFHEDIPHSGRRLGGSQYAIRSNKLLLSGKSKDLGRIHVPSVQKCVDTFGLEVITKEVDRTLSYGSLEEYLSRE